MESDASRSAHDVSWLTSHDPANDDWETVILVLPRIALLVGRAGVRQKLLMPGQYQTRMSRSLNRRIYRRR